MHSMVLLINAVRGLARGFWVTQSTSTLSSKALNNRIHNTVHPRSWWCYDGRWWTVSLMPRVWYRWWAEHQSVTNHGMNDADGQGEAMDLQYDNIHNHFMICFPKCIISCIVREVLGPLKEDYDVPVSILLYPNKMLFLSVLKSKEA